MLMGARLILNFLKNFFLNIQTSLSFPQCSSNNSRFSAYRSLWKPLRRWFLLKIPAFTFRSTLKDKMKGFRGKWGTIVKRNSIHFDFFPVTYLYPLSLFSAKHTYINVHFLLRYIFIHFHFLLTHIFFHFHFLSQHIYIWNRFQL